MKTGSEEPWYTPTILAFLGQDVPRATGLDPQLFVKDVTTLSRRLSAEGESFLLKTLPAFGKSIDLALQGHVPLATPLFKKRGRSALPAFLSALLRRVFSDDGWVKDNPCIISIRLIRQLCFWCKKLQKGYSDESLRKALADFIEVDKALPSKMHDLLPSADLLGTARVVIERIFRHVENPTRSHPSHGPGAVAGGEGTVGKRGLKISYKRLEEVFRPIPWFRSLRDVTEDLDEFFSRPRREYGISRLEFVEKDSSGPRTIGLEPAEYMWCQQALKDLMYHHIECTPNVARGHVNFTDQTVNRELARNWSDFETLDMSKASDRNSYVLVKYLFGQTRLWPWLRASRTPGTLLPNGEILMYKKFAPMGSAVCFPVEACVFYALACAALHLAGMPLYLACRNTYVYGDDLIVPRGFFDSLDAAFSSVGLSFNKDKCCTHGKFRESCGLDAYDGHDVTPVRMRVARCDGDTDVVRLVKHSNRLAIAGFWAASSVYERCLKREFSQLFRKLRLPRACSTSLPILHWYDVPEFSTLRIRVVNSIAYVKGWALRTCKCEGNDADEVRYLRESLSRGGPVGSLSARTVSRLFDLRYRGCLTKVRLPVFADISNRLVSDEHRGQTAHNDCVPL